MLPETAPLDDETPSTRPYASPLRFKKDERDDGKSRPSKRRRLSPTEATKADREEESSYKDDSHRHDRRSHRRKHRSHRHTDSKRETSGQTQDTLKEGDATLDPDAAFRESLFDAMADDEGADYWEGIYGQPIHVYPNTRQGPEGGLERMTDEEYVSHVRANMWAKTHQGILEERARREKVVRERQEEKRKGEQARADADGLKRQMEESLQRGQQRRARKGWKQVYETYSKRWEVLRAAKEPDEVAAAKAQMPWPVRSGVAKDVTTPAVEEFMRQTEEFSNDGRDSGARLKAERVRWHPDKMQQRLGVQGLNETELKLVTAIFQVLDDMWSRERASKK